MIINKHARGGPGPAARLISRFLVVLAGFLAAWPMGAGAAYPDHAIRLIVPYGPGGAGDIVARTVTARMSLSLGQPFIIENRPSAGGVVATEAVAKAAPDGYTLLLMNNGHAISSALFKHLPYDVVADFSPITTISTVGMVMLVPSESTLHTVGDFIEAAKAKPAAVNLGSVNIGSSPHLAAELFKSMANPKQEIVPFNNTAAVISALRGQQIQAAIEFITPVLGQIKGGALRPLAVTTAKRSTVLPQVPTFAESGVPGYEAASWNGLAAPQGTPQAIVDHLNQAVREAVADPEVKAKLQTLGAEPRVMSPAEMRTLMTDEIVKWKAVIEQAGIPLQ